MSILSDSLNTRKPLRAGKRNFSQGSKEEKTSLVTDMR
jgi:hypothetical protein